MKRTSVISALLVAIGSASPAAADDCMCLHGNGLVNADPILESFEVGPFFSSDGTLLVSAQLEPRAKENRQSDEVLWCASPYDPRCSPASPSPETPRANLSGGSSAANIEHRHDWPELVESTPEHHAAEAMLPSAGVRSRVERPPRS
jgi:hypothetical protein